MSLGVPLFLQRGARQLLLIITKALAKDTRKSTEVIHSRQLTFRLSTHLRGLALTLVELKFIRKSMQVFHRLATQCKSTQVDHKSTVYT